MLFEYSEIIVIEKYNFVYSDYSNPQILQITKWITIDIPSFADV